MMCRSGTIKVPTVFVMLAILSLAVSSGGNGTDGGASISEAVYVLLSARVTANQAHFFVYQDADSGFNHGFPSGFFGATHKIDLDTVCVDDPTTANGCSVDPSRVDRERGTVLQISFSPLAPGEFVGVNVEEPENFGTLRTGVGYDLRDATHVVFDVRTPTPGGIDVQFGVGGQTTGFFHIPQSSTYTTLSILLSSLTPSPPDLTDVHLLFTVVTNDLHAPSGGTVLLDNIRFEPVPVSQQNALSFPLSTQTFGVMPLQDPAPGRVPFPPDQVLRNLTTTYESALTVLALLARGTEADWRHARLIADAFHYALHHDNQGDPLPVAPDGAVGLHNAYASGDLALFNDQVPPAAGRKGDVRLAGFSASPALCGPTGFCLLLDGATGGNNAFAILALVAAYKLLHDARYLDDARTIGNWIVAHLTDTTNTGFGGYYLGYPDEGVVPKTLITAKSTENNADIFAAFTALATAVGEAAEATVWTARANFAGDFVMAMFDPVTGCFHAGTVPVGTPSGPGIDPTGPQKGNDVINAFPFLDAQTFPTLALAAAPRYQNQIDWRRPVQCVLDHFAQQVAVDDQAFSGFNLVETPTAGPNGIAWEFTGQAVVAMQVADRLYQGALFEADTDLYLNQIRQAQSIAPFGNAQGLVASTLQDGDSLPPLEQCLSTPFQCIPERVELAATTWAVFADQNANPLAGCAPCGDVNRDGAVTPADALLAFQFFLGLTTLTPCQFDAADVDFSGTITPADALEVFKKFLGLEHIVAACPAPIPPPLQFFHAEERDLVGDLTGEKLAFRGVNLNGLEFGSFFDNPYPGIEGTNYFQPRPEDFDSLKDAGFSVIRVPFEWARLMTGWQPTDPLPTALDPAYLGLLDAVVQMAAERHLYVLLDMHDFLKYWSGPSAQECVDTSPAHQQLLARTWQLLATHFRDTPAVLGYDIMNEPVRQEPGEQCGSCNWHAIAQAVVDAIRAVDGQHLIFVEGLNFSLASDWPVENGKTPFITDRVTPPRVVYSPHVFFDFNNDSRYDQPGEATGPLGQWQDYVRDRLLPVIAWSMDHNVPMFIGETNVPCTADWAVVLDHAFRNFFEPLQLSVLAWHFINPVHCPLEICPLNLATCAAEHQFDVLKQFPGGPYQETGNFTPTPSDSHLYDDERVNPWDAGNGFFDALTLNFCATAPVFDGSCALSVHFDQNNFAGVKFVHHFGVDTRRLKTLKFSIFLSGTGQQNFKIFTTAPRSDCNPGVDPFYPQTFEQQPVLRDFLPSPSPGQWQHVEIPLAAIVNPAEPIINGIAFQNMGTRQDVLYLDSIRLTP